MFNFQLLRALGQQFLLSTCSIFPSLWYVRSKSKWCWPFLCPWEIFTIFSNQVAICWLPQLRLKPRSDLDVHWGYPNSQDLRMESAMGTDLQFRPFQYVSMFGEISDPWWTLRTYRIQMLIHWLVVWSLEPWNFMTFHSVGNFRKSQLTIRSIIFQRG